MGQCYSVKLRVTFKDEQGAKAALLEKSEKGEQEHVDYDMQGLQELGFNFDNILDLMSVFFCGWSQKLKATADKAWLYSDFETCYGWEGVMIDAFNIIAPYLEDKSEIRIYPDNGCDRAIVKKGKAVWVS